MPSVPEQFACAPVYSYPWIVGAEIPQAAFGIAAAETLAAVILELQFDHDFGTSSLGALVHSGGIFDDQIRTLCFVAADLIRLFEEVIEIGLVAYRADDDHAVAEGELGMNDGTVRIL